MLCFFGCCVGLGCLIGFFFFWIFFDVFCFWVWFRGTRLRLVCLWTFFLLCSVFFWLWVFGVGFLFVVLSLIFGVMFYVFFLCCVWGWVVWGLFFFCEFLGSVCGLCVFFVVGFLICGVVGLCVWGWGIWLCVVGFLEVNLIVVVGVRGGGFGFVFCGFLGGFLLGWGCLLGVFFVGCLFCCSCVLGRVVGCLCCCLFFDVWDCFVGCVFGLMIV